MTVMIATPVSTWNRAAEIVEGGVNFSEHTIELIVIPYETETDVPHPTKPAGPRVREVISRGAFDGIERRANRVKVNRDHDLTRLFGRAVSFHPHHERGLHAKIRVSATDLGEETLLLANDGVLEASAGFLPQPNVREGLHWENPGRYRIRKAWLHHIALVPDGAYGEHAPVLAVRAADPGSAAAGEPAATPNRQALELALAREAYAAIDARYGV